MSDQQPYAPQSYAPQSYPQQPYGPGPGYGVPAAVVTDPGRTLGIAGLVLSILVAFVGLIVSIVAFRRSKAAGFKNGFALGGIVIGSVLTATWVIGGIIGGIAVANAASACAELGPGTHQVDGVTYTCS